MRKTHLNILSKYVKNESVWKDCHVNSRIKWVDDAVLLPSGVWGKSISWVKERHCIMVKDTIYQEDLTISNAYTLIAEF